MYMINIRVVHNNIYIAMGIRIYDGCCSGGGGVGGTSKREYRHLYILLLLYRYLCVYIYIYPYDNNNVRRVLSLGVPRLNIKRTARDSGH